MFALTVVTPEQKFVTDAEVEEVIVPGYRGELGILPGHAPLVTTLRPGILRFRRKGSQLIEKMSVSWGYCEVSPKGVSILAETAESSDQVDIERARLALDNANKKLSTPLSTAEIEKYQRKAERARVRLDLAKKH